MVVSSSGVAGSSVIAVVDGQRGPTHGAVGKVMLDVIWVDKV